MVKTKNSTKVLAILVALILILTALIFIIPNRQTQTVEAAELTPEQHAERRATPGLYETGTTDLITRWEDLVSSGVITVSSGSFKVNSNISKGDLVCKSIDNLTTLANIFENCANLTMIDCYNLNTSNVTDMSCMFMGCTELKSIVFGNFATNLVDNMGSMFTNCTNLVELDLSSFNTSNVTISAQMFFGCSSLKTLNLSNFNTDKINNFMMMFSGCNINELNISSFKFSSSSDTTGILGLHYEDIKNMFGDETANQVFYGKDKVDLTEDKMVDDNSKVENFVQIIINFGMANNENEARQMAKAYLITSINKIVAPKTIIPSDIKIALPGATGYMASGSKATEPVFTLNGMEGKTLVPFSSSQDVPSTGVVSNMLSVVICLACLSALVITLTNKKRKMVK